MSTPESYRRFRDTHGDVARNFSMGTQDEQAACYSDLQQLSAKAENDLREIYGNYLQELEAAASGDDSIQRATVAYRNLQREYARIQADYVKESQLRNERMYDTLNSLTSTSSAKALDTWIEYLNELRQNLASKDESKSKGNKPTS
jgi:hypothetical protein